MVSTPRRIDDKRRTGGVAVVQLVTVAIVPIGEETPHRGKTRRD